MIELLRVIHDKIITMGCARVTTHHDNYKIHLHGGYITIIDGMVIIVGQYNGFSLSHTSEFSISDPELITKIVAAVKHDFTSHLRRTSKA